MAFYRLLNNVVSNPYKTLRKDWEKPQENTGKNPEMCRHTGYPDDKGTDGFGYNEYIFALVKTFRNPDALGGDEPHGT